MRAFRNLRLALAMLTGLAGMIPLSAGAQPLTILGTVAAADWHAYLGHFVDGSGRVVDDANGNISHSEGQGYGMLLAFAAGDRASFERIWSFTQTALLLRDDGLAVWRWQPATPHVPDTNDASDGDILIAYALAIAGNGWSDPRYTAAATLIAESVAAKLIVVDDGVTLLLPGVDGFSRMARPDGPVVNLSYWIFEALPWMAKLAPEGDWKGLSQSGLALIRAARFGKSALPSDWVSVRDRTARPAADFEPEFGYNAIRIPFYMMRAGIDDATLYEPFLKAWGGQGAGLAVIDINSDKISAELTDPGYRMLAATLACVVRKVKIPAELKLFVPTVYYPSTLHLLSLSFLAERHPECL